MITHVAYDPGVHSRERLLQQIEAILHHRDRPFLIGSFGRAAVLGSEQEFVVRGETPECRDADLARDIDVLFADCRAVDCPPAPFPVDTTALTTHEERIVHENGDYWLVDDLARLAIRIDSDVFAPQRYRLFGELEVATFSARTHLNLLFVVYGTPRKYHQAKTVLEEHLDEKPCSAAEVDLYAPFAEFQRRRRSSLLNHCRHIYRRTVPLSMRCTMSPLLRTLKRGLTRL